MERLAEIEVHFEQPGTPYSVDVIDDGLVAYAYLLRDDVVVGDVWLYNRGPAPIDLPWKRPNARNEMPFENPAVHVREVEFARVSKPEEVEFLWNENAAIKEVAIFIRRRIHAIVGEGDRPGWCVLASRDGLLAKVLDIAPDAERTEPRERS